MASSPAQLTSITIAGITSTSVHRSFFFFLFLIFFSEFFFLSRSLSFFCAGLGDAGIEKGGVVTFAVTTGSNRDPVFGLVRPITDLFYFRAFFALAVIRARASVVVTPVPLLPGLTRALSLTHPLTRALALPIFLSHAALTTSSSH
ncbi:hypothetical protein BZA05DRAFT_392230 [Tricharina praecox]|uniref:uncharacterized protein n=1 Tax=Tricharina praecox TaxID=43433 RepID=UPI0022203149|nr:uncharacterized protein BZA05DRAFT_392230 [Tricharina praecox]KAI5854676.1 hypothetical protein BZA05DRAFT_392230 [Tricharina praecox]